MISWMNTSVREKRVILFDVDELIIFEFTNPYLDLEQKNACA